MDRIDVIVDGLFGSCGKGALAAWLARGYRPDAICVRVAGPNAGHTVVGDKGADTSESSAPGLCKPLDEQDPDGTFPLGAGDAEAKGGRFAWALRQVPVGLVSNPMVQGCLAAGSEIDPPVLLNEIDCLDVAGYGVARRLTVDLVATVIGDEHKATESGLATSIGSTGKGIGAARADRLMRREGLLLAEHPGLIHELTRRGVEVASDTADWLNHGDVSTVQIEGTQGYGLGLHAVDATGAPFYPYCTSSDCRAIDFMAMAGVSPWTTHPVSWSTDGQPGQIRQTVQTSIWMALRPYPIRVGGNSGPLRGETDWAELGLAPERTTVTQKVRRVGAWDPELVAKAIQANGGLGPQLNLALMMFDQVVPAVAGWHGPIADVFDPQTVAPPEVPALRDAWARAHDRLDGFERSLTGLLGQRVSFTVLGTGPDTILDLRDRTRAAPTEVSRLRTGSAVQVAPPAPTARTEG